MLCYYLLIVLRITRKLQEAVKVELEEFTLELDSIFFKNHKMTVFFYNITFQVW